MENATKALLMAAGVLIGIVILSLGVYLYGTIGNYVQMSQEEMNNQALIKFNTQFYNYTALNLQLFFLNVFFLFQYLMMDLLHQ